MASHFGWRILYSDDAKPLLMKKFIEGNVANAESVMRRPSQDALMAAAIDALYEALAAPATWADALDAVDRLLQSHSAHFLVWDNASHTRIVGYKAPSFDDYHPKWNYYHQINPRREILLHLPPGTPLNCKDYLDDRTVSRSEYFVDYSLPAGRRYLLGANVLHEDGLITACAVARGPRDVAFSDRDRILFERLIPHLRRVARIHRRLHSVQAEAGLAGTALDRVAAGVAVTDARAAVIRANHAAAKMFEAASPLRCDWGRLGTKAEAETARLRAMIADAVRPRRDSTQAGGTMAVTDAEGVRWGILVAPLMPRGEVFDLAGRRLALVIASRLSGPATPEQRLREVFGLTAAEARLAAELVAGKTLDDVSEERQVSLATVRSQLRSVFQKTETGRQAQLMQLITSLPDISDA